MLTFGFFFHFINIQMVHVFHSALKIIVRAILCKERSLSLVVGINSHRDNDCSSNTHTGRNEKAMYKLFIIWKKIYIVAQQNFTFMEVTLKKRSCVQNMQKSVVGEVALTPMITEGFWKSSRNLISNEILINSFLRNQSDGLAKC